MDLLLLACLVLVAIGLIGTVVPGMPGLPLVLAGIVVYAVGSGFRVIGPGQLVLMVLLGLLGIGLSFVGTLVGARRFGASRAALLGALLGLVAGLVLLGPLLGPFALILGPLGGAVVAEMWRGQELSAALRSGLGVLIGYVFGSLLEIIIAVSLVAWLLASVWGELTGGGRGVV
jgi:uncharacterized protein YqgC (DUF456 family)